MKEKFITYNPSDKPVEDLPYIYGFNNGGGDSNWCGLLIAEDGASLGRHICSSEGWMYGDLGIIDANSGRHKRFKEHYPNGYKMYFVTYNDAAAHEGLQKALKAQEVIIF